MHTDLISMVLCPKSMICHRNSVLLLQKKDCSGVTAFNAPVAPLLNKLIAAMRSM
jgi:hypothetical protein